MNHSLSSLSTAAVAMADYPEDLQAQVEQAGQLWQQFCALPQAAKNRLTAAPDPSGAINGYETKDGSGPNGDRKENFDVTPGYSPTIQESSVAGDFVATATQLTNAIADFAILTARGIETAHNVPNLEAIVRASRPSTFVRFLHYFGDNDATQSFAQPHTDQSGFTFHRYETAPGCERLDPATRTWQPLPVVPGRTVLFPAMQLQLLSGGALKALCHRVVTTTATSQQGRYAIVAFMRFENTPAYDKATHGRLQEMEPGFNYDLTPQKFAKLFSEQ